MYFMFLLFFIILKICSSAVLFGIYNTNKNISVPPSYFLGTVHAPQSLIWPYLPNNIIQILNESDEIWVEQDLTDPKYRMYIYECIFNAMSPKQKSDLRKTTWSTFVNETKINDTIFDRNYLIKWKEWYINNQFISYKVFWRNQTINDNDMFDLRIMLDAYQRNIYVGSLEPLRTDCYQIDTLSKKRDVSNEYISEYFKEIIWPRLYNCDLLNEEIFNAMSEIPDDSELKTRNTRMTMQIRKLLKTNPQKKYLFVIGSAHLFTNISIIQMMKDQFPNDYHIKQLNASSQNFPSDKLCTEQEIERITNQINSSENKTIKKRFLNNVIFD